MRSKLQLTDAELAILDHCVNAVEQVAEPHLKNPEQAREFAAEVIEHMQTHLAADLEFIAGGEGDGFSDPTDTGSFASRLRAAHAARSGKQRVTPRQKFGKERRP